MANTWDVGDEPRLTVEFTAAGVAQSPPAAVIVVKKPNEVTLSYVSDGFTLQGTWNAATNNPSLADGTGTQGHYYTVSVAGSQTFGDEIIAFSAGDWIYYNGKVWRRLTNVQATTLTESSEGVFYVDQYLTIPGIWYYGADGVGQRSAAEDYFIVKVQDVS